MKYELDFNEGEYLLDGNKLHHSCFRSMWLPEPPKVILDIGSFDFGDSIRFKKEFPRCEVHGFELLKSNYDKFSPLAESIGVITHNYAVSDVDGEAEFYESIQKFDEPMQSSLLKPSKVYTDTYDWLVKHVPSTSKVKTKTIKTFCEENYIKDIDLAHIDVEGAEHKVFVGFGDIRPKMIYAEFLFENGWENQESFGKTLDLLDGMGYNMVGDFQHDKLFVLR